LACGAGGKAAALSNPTEDPDPKETADTKEVDGMDIFEKCPEYTYAGRYASGYYPYFIPMTDNEGCEAIYQGRRVIMCGSNNYLGLTTHPKVREAAIEAVKRYGTSVTGSRFANGTLELHEQLERELATWVGKEAALTFTTGMQTNMGAISSLVGRGDVVILDKDDHASIVDGARLGWGSLKRFRHNDVADLERVLASLPDEAGRLVVVDGLYSMGGDPPPLPDLVRVCRQYGAADGGRCAQHGQRGGRAPPSLRPDGRDDLTASTFSKSFASSGDLWPATIIHYMKHHARALIFSASSSPSNTAAALAALHVMQEEPERIERINQIGERMRRELKGLGFDILQSVSPIIPIHVGDDMRTLAAWKMLFEGGVFVNPVVSPAVPEGQQLLRTSYMATHTDEQLDRALEVFAQVGKQIGLIQRDSIHVSQATHP
jgi:7-keto-8-aminopelargonate synthetase-like enzyme